MHDAHGLIPLLAAGFSVALALGYITHRLGLSPIVGYLLAGIVVGPHTPGFSGDLELAKQLAEIGVVLLLFGVGMQFHLKELLAVRNIAVPGSLIGSVVATSLGAGVGQMMGWSLSSSILFGMSIAVASTVVMLRVLADNRDLHTSTGHIAVGWLVVEDLMTVIALVMIPTLFGEGSSMADAPKAAAIALVKVALLLGFVFWIGGRFIPALLMKVAASRSRELFTLTVLVVALGIAVGSAKVFGVSMELGAFLAGMVVGRSEFSFRAASEALPMRDAFAVLFFVSVGMLLDPDSISQAPGLLLATVAVVLIGNPLVAFVMTFLFRYPMKTVLGVTVALMQIGEFSFILANMGAGLEILSPTAANTVIATAIVTISLNPLLYRAVSPLEQWLMRHPKWGPWLENRSRRGVPVEGAEPDTRSSSDPRDRAVVVGGGPVGMTVARLLRENGVEPTIIDLNLKTVHGLKEEGRRAVYGDATRRETLVGAGLANAGTLILSAPNVPGSPEIIRLVRELNPDVRVLARTTYLTQCSQLTAAGADEVFAEEGEVALAFAVAVMESIGATPEQVERERQRVHDELAIRTQPTDGKLSVATTTA